MTIVYELAPSIIVAVVPIIIFPAVQLIVVDISHSRALLGNSWERDSLQLPCIPILSVLSIPESSADPVGTSILAFYPPFGNYTLVFPDGLLDELSSPLPYEI
jgi:hypothetical protein